MQNRNNPSYHGHCAQCGFEDNRGNYYCNDCHSNSHREKCQTCGSANCACACNGEPDKRIITQRMINYLQTKGNRGFAIVSAGLWDTRKVETGEMFHRVIRIPVMVEKTPTLRNMAAEYRMSDMPVLFKKFNLTEKDLPPLKYLYDVRVDARNLSGELSWAKERGTAAVDLVWIRPLPGFPEAERLIEIGHTTLDVVNRSSARDPFCVYIPLWYNK